MPAVKRPRRRAAEEFWAAYRLTVKQHKLSQRAVELFRDLRLSLDRAGSARQCLLVVGDNSFCNRTLFTAALERSAVIARARRDVKLCQRAPAGSRCFYDATRFTPEQIRQDDSLAWRKARVFYGGQWRNMRYKEVRDVFWRTGCRKRVLRLLVVAPIPYRVPGRRRRISRSGLSINYGLARNSSRTSASLCRPLADRGKPS